MCDWFDCCVAWNIIMMVDEKMLGIDDVRCMMTMYKNIIGSKE